MEDSIEILSPISEWTVFQQNNGYVDIHLNGTVHVSNVMNYPVIRVVDVCCEETVVYEKLSFSGSEWQCTVRLKTGIYRIETGIALKLADFNPYYLARGDMLRNLFVGEVFVIAGQSNAAGYGKGEICDIPQYGVSMSTDTWKIAAHPISQMQVGSPNTDELNCGHSAWLSLGKRILEHTNTPVGLISVALNGSGIRSWGQGTPLFENMINKAQLSGAEHLIWYQGCTDTDEPDGYAYRLDSLMQGIRQRLGDIEIYMIQISGTTNTARPELGWRIVREAQRSIAVKYHALLIPAYDLFQYSDDIHLSPKDNIRLAERIYQRYADKRLSGAVNVRRDQAIELEFADVEQLSSNDAANLLALDGCGKPVACDIEVSGNTIRIESRDISVIRYITLPFGRIYEGRTLKDASGNCLAYFYIDMDTVQNATAHFDNKNKEET